MKSYFITGTSSGIGKALAEQLLQHEDVRVLGISRRNPFQHERFTHKRVELSLFDEIEKIQLPITGDETELVLINNAGWVGEIAPLGKVDHAALEESLNINLLAPMMLINHFLDATKDLDCRKVIINISSGAANYPVRGWSSYCASKAGLDMITRVVNEESPEIETYSIAPGVVDTTMQQVIRDAKPELFPDLERFKEYKESGQLISPDAVASKIIHLINHPEEIPDKVFSLRDIK